MVCYIERKNALDKKKKKINVKLLDSTHQWIQVSNLYMTKENLSLWSWEIPKVSG